MPKGRRKGTVKADISKAFKMRSQGKSNEEIANALGISSRTVTRYLTPDSLTKSTTINWKKLFAVNGELSKSMELMLLRLANDPRWRRKWNSERSYIQCESVILKRMFEAFLRRCEQAEFFEQSDRLYQEIEADSVKMEDAWRGYSIADMHEYLRRRRESSDATGDDLF